MSKKFTFKQGSAQKILSEWWGWLEQNRGERAYIRRCSNTEEIFFCSGFYELLKNLEEIENINPEQIAPIAGLAVHFREIDKSISFAEQMSKNRQGSDMPVVSENRFRRLVTTKERNDLYKQLIRIINLLDKRGNLYDMADSVYYWGESVRKRWAADYYRNFKRR